MRTQSFDDKPMGEFTSIEFSRTTVFTVDIRPEQKDFDTESSSANMAASHN
jgi:hypothetical protein